MKKADLVVGERYEVRYRTSLECWGGSYYYGRNYKQKLTTGSGTYTGTMEQGFLVFDMSDGGKGYVNIQGVKAQSKKTGMEEKVERTIARLEADGLSAAKRKELLDETCVFLGVLGIKATRMPKNAGIQISVSEATALNSLITNMMGKELGIK